MISNLINEFMSLDVKSVTGKDCTRLCFCFFVYENELFFGKPFSVSEFSTYVFRFYMDNTMFRELNPNKIIQKLFKYSPTDIYDYCSLQLDIIRNTMPSLIKLDKSNHYFKTLENNITKEVFLSRFKLVINAMMIKYLNMTNYWYTQELTLNEINLALEAQNLKNSRIFNRALEIINYCFICDTIDTEQLEPVSLTPLEKLNDSVKLNMFNYIVLCSNHAKNYNEGLIRINKLGYLIDHEKNYREHLPINVVKKIREFLNDCSFNGDFE